MSISSVSFTKLLVICILIRTNALGKLEDYEITCKDDEGKSVDW